MKDEDLRELWDNFPENKEDPEIKNPWVKYKNFTLSVRKPSFIVFLIFIVLSIIGIYQTFWWVVAILDFIF